MATQVTQPVKTLERINAYTDFLRSEGIPVITGFAVEDLKTLELAPWARKGGRGAYVNLEGTGGTNDAYVSEIAPGGSLNPERHLFNGAPAACSPSPSMHTSSTSMQAACGQLAFFR